MNPTQIAKLITENPDIPSPEGTHESSGPLTIAVHLPHAIDAAWNLTHPLQLPKGAEYHPHATKRVQIVQRYFNAVTQYLDKVDHNLLFLMPGNPYTLTGWAKQDKFTVSPLTPEQREQEQAQIKDLNGDIVEYATAQEDEPNVYLGWERSTGDSIRKSPELKKLIATASHITLIGGNTDGGCLTGVHRLVQALLKQANRNVHIQIIEELTFIDDNSFWDRWA